MSVIEVETLIVGGPTRVLDLQKVKGLAFKSTNVAQYEQNIVVHSLNNLSRLNLP